MKIRAVTSLTMVTPLRYITLFQSGGGGVRQITTHSTKLICHPTQLNWLGNPVISSLKIGGLLSHFTLEMVSFKQRLLVCIHTSWNIILWFSVLVSTYWSVQKLILSVIMDFKAKLYIPSAINIQMNLTILLFLDRLGHKCNIEIFWNSKDFFSYFHGKTIVKLQFL